jgi:hypothetical protein
VFALQSFDSETILACMLGQRNMEGSLVTVCLKNHFAPPNKVRKQVPGSSVVLGKVAARVDDPEHAEQRTRLDPIAEESVNHGNRKLNRQKDTYHGAYSGRTLKSC